MRNSAPLLTALKQNPFILAPMAGITDCPFRSLMREMGSPIVVTELVSAHGLQYASEKTRRLMDFTPEQHPIGVQIFGEEPEVMARAALTVQETGADFVDLNFGCPVPKVVKKGAGSAMLKDPVALGRLLKAVVAAVNIPVTIKTRTGWDEGSRNADVVSEIAYNEGVSWVAIHGRTRAQGYEGDADWDYIAEVKVKAKLPILGNGDVLTPQAACDRLKASGCDGVLIGRGALKDPWIFRDSLRIWSNLEEEPTRNFTVIFSRLHSLLEQYYDERHTLIQLKKFAAWFSSGYPGSSQFRRGLFQTESLIDLREKIFAYFSHLEEELVEMRKDGQIEGLREDQSREQFLKGGHG